jgi:hypothetical protein
MNVIIINQLLLDESILGHFSIYNMITQLIQLSKL